MQSSRATRRFSSKGIAMKSHVFCLALVSAINIVAGASAHAQTGTLTRSFVSSTGVDGNSCMIAAPCASFAYAYTKVGANGIVAALDPGKYGPITITSPVTINGNGWAAITGPSGGAAITVNAALGNVTLIGLELDGAGASNHGIYLTSNLSNQVLLTIRNCDVSNFVDSGIAIQPTQTSGGIVRGVNVSIANTFSLNNYDGIKVAPGGGAYVWGTISGSTVANNANNGFDFEGSTEITLLNSVATTNIGYGIQDNVSGSLTIRDTVLMYNATDLFAESTGQSYFYHNTIGSFGGSGNFFSDGTNAIQNEGTTAPTKQSTY
jgi:hypothetical protein